MKEAPPNAVDPQAAVGRAPAPTANRGDSAGADQPLLVDARGQRCPLPLLLARRAIDSVPPGARVMVVGDDPDIPRDFEAWCAESGHRLLALDRDEKLFRVLVECVPT